ncbi:MAG: aspartate/glutamate racemase family protein [Pseudomonadota bacterium]
MTDSLPPRVALIHAVEVAMAPTAAAFEDHWPAAERVNIWDDSLSVDRARDGALTPAMGSRIAALGDYALSTNVAAVLFTCSAFGPAIAAFAARSPVLTLKPNEAMFDAALRAGDRIGMLATFAPSVESMEAEFHEAARLQGRSARIKTVLVADALEALQTGDVERHNALLADAAAQLEGCDALMLAQFSTSRARQAVEGRVRIPVLTSPESAVRTMRSAVDKLAPTS